MQRGAWSSCRCFDESLLLLLLLLGGRGKDDPQLRDTPPRCDPCPAHRFDTMQRQRSTRNQRKSGKRGARKLSVRARIVHDSIITDAAACVGKDETALLKVIVEEATHLLI